MAKPSTSCPWEPTRTRAAPSHASKKPRASRSMWSRPARTAITPSCSTIRTTPDGALRGIVQNETQTIQPGASMLTEDGKHLYVSYDEYHNLIEKLALKVHQSGWQFDTILCLARGGMRPGDVLSRIFDVPLAIMSTSSYRAEAGTVQGHLDIARFITTPKEIGRAHV